MQLVRRLLDPHAEAEAVGLLAEPDAVVLGAPHEAEVRRVEAEDGAVVDHAARVVAERRVDDLPVGEPADVARHRRLQELLRVRPEHLPLPQRREVHDRGALAARPVLVDRAVVVVGRRQPVAVVLGEPPGQRGRARVERGLARQPRLRVRRHAVGDRRREALLRGVDADVHLGRVPRVRGVDVVGAGAREADEVGVRAEEDVVAGPRPRLVRDEHVVGVEGGVEEEVERRPALSRLDRVRQQLRVEVVRAVDVAEVAHVLVVLRVARQREGVVPADGVADDLDQRLLVGVVELPVQPRLRVRVPHQRACRRRVEAALVPRLELLRVEGQEVGALAALHVDHLDVLAGPHLVRERGGARHLEVEPRVGERLRQRGLSFLARCGAADLQLQVGRGDAALHDGLAGGGGDGDERRADGAERLLGAGRRGGAEELLRPVRAELERRVVAARDREHAALAAVDVADRQPVVRPQLDGRRRPRPHAVRLAQGIPRQQARHEQAGSGRGRQRNAS